MYFAGPLKLLYKILFKHGLSHLSLSGNLPLAYGQCCGPHYSVFPPFSFGGEINYALPLNQGNRQKRLPCYIFVSGIRAERKIDFDIHKQQIIRRTLSVIYHIKVLIYIQFGKTNSTHLHCTSSATACQRFAMLFFLIVSSYYRISQNHRSVETGRYLWNSPFLMLLQEIRRKTSRLISVFSKQVLNTPRMENKQSFWATCASV